MRALAAMLFVGGLLAVASLGTAQPPEGGKEGPKGGKGDKGPGGKGGRDFGKGGRFGPPPIGQVLPPFVQDQLKLTDAQKKELESIQKDVDAKLNKLLTDDQKQMLKQMRERGPGGFGPKGPGGPGGFPGEKGGKGGNPPPKKDNKDE
jgi:Spy/CpxP family protein refolding chaperone